MNAKEKQDIFVAADPGIRLVLSWLWSRGFETSDSGDGVTKFAPDSEYDPHDLIAIPHVAVVPHVLMNVLEQSEHLFSLAERVSLQPVRLEATRSWPERVWTILFFPSVEWIADLENQLIHNV